MANINTYLAQIMEARYGKDVRQAIHDSIQQINNDVSVDNQDVVQKLGPYVDQKIITKQDKLVAGTGISIAADGKTISSTVQSDVTKAYVDQSDLVPVKENIATLDHQVETLEDASEGRLYTSTATSGSGTQTVPDGALCRAIVKEYDGKTVVQDGALVSADVSAVKSVGRNLFTTADFPNGFTDDYNTVTSVILDSNSYSLTSIHTANRSTYVRNIQNILSVGESYYFRASGRDNIRLNVDGVIKGTLPLIYTVTGNENQINMYCAIPPGDTIISDILIARASTSVDYAPYTSDTRTIPSSVRTSYPLRSAGEVHDSISFDGAKWWHTKRVGTADLGSLSWSYNGVISDGSAQFISELEDRLQTNTLQAIQTKYERLDSAGQMHDGTIFFRNAQPKFLVNTSMYTDASSFKAGVSGVMLYYELATPIITDITALMNWDASIAVEAGGTVEFSNQQLLDVDNVVEYKVGKSVVSTTQLNEAIVTLGNAKQDVISDLSTIRSGAAAGAAALPANPSNWPTMTSAQQDTACAVVGAERKLADGWVLKGTMTDTNGITVDLTGCTELAVFGVAVVTANTSIMSNIGRLSYNCLKTNAKAVLLIYEDSVWGFCCTHAKSANSTAPVTMADNSAGDSKVDGSKLADINSIYFSDPTNVISCNIKIYAR